MDKNKLKRLLPVVVFILSLILIIESSAFGLKQKKERELALRIEQAEREAEEKIYLTGKFSPAEQENFGIVPKEYTVGENEIYLRRETLYAFLQMAAAANKDKVELKISSATRNFDDQRDFWNKKWLENNNPENLEKFKKNLEYIAVPGTSRHHWGTEIDINDANVQYFETKKGKEVYEWLVQNSSSFGFCQTYANKEEKMETAGYNEEKWHWSYLPLARVFWSDYKNLIKEEDLKGFLGDEYVLDFNLINDYVLSINPECA